MFVEDLYRIRYLVSRCNRADGGAIGWRSKKLSCNDFYGEGARLIFGRRERADPDIGGETISSSDVEWRATGKAMLARLVSRSEEHTSELQSLMRNSYAAFCSKKKTTTIQTYKD